MPHRIIILLILLTFTTATHRITAAELKPELAATMDRWEKSWNAGDLEALAAVQPTSVHFRDSFEFWFKVYGKITGYMLKTTLPEPESHILRLSFEKLGESPALFTFRQSEDGTWQVAEFNLGRDTTQERNDAAMENLLRLWKEAFNSGSMERAIALHHPTAPLRLAFHHQEGMKEHITEGWKEIMAEFGQLTAFELKGYNQDQGKYLVLASHEKAGEVPTTFIIRQRQEGPWAIYDFDFDVGDTSGFAD